MRQWIIINFNTLRNEVKYYGPFNSLERAQEWIKARPELDTQFSGIVILEGEGNYP